MKHWTVVVILTVAALAAVASRPAEAAACPKNPGGSYLRTCFHCVYSGRTTQCDCLASPRDGRLVSTSYTSPNGLRCTEKSGTT